MQNKKYIAIAWLLYPYAHSCLLPCQCPRPYWSQSAPCLSPCNIDESQSTSAPYQCEMVCKLPEMAFYDEDIQKSNNCICADCPIKICESNDIVDQQYVYSIEEFKEYLQNTYEQHECDEILNQIYSVYSKRKFMLMIEYFPIEISSIPNEAQDVFYYINEHFIIQDKQKLIKVLYHVCKTQDANYQKSDAVKLLNDILTEKEDASLPYKGINVAEFIKNLPKLNSDTSYNVGNLTKAVKIASSPSTEDCSTNHCCFFNDDQNFRYSN